MKRAHPPIAIAFANGKGGSGKTSLLANLAVCAATLDKSNVALLDYDPQQSLARWWELRGDVLNPRLIPDTGRNASVAIMEEKARGADYVLLDLPPALWHVIEDAISVADLVVVPVKASPLDLEAADPIIEACRDLRRDFVFVLTQYDKTWKLSPTAFPYLQQKAAGHTLTETMGYRQAYVGSIIAGATGAEYSADKKQAAAAAAEIKALWLAVRKRALDAVK